MSFHERAVEIVKNMSMEEKVYLFCSRSLSLTEGIKKEVTQKEEISPVKIAEGTQKLHLERESLRQEFIGIHETTDFPANSMLACSFDEKMVEEVGKALGEECLEHGISLLLGPKANVKRSPLQLDGENYFSEDPLLTGKMAAGMIRGIQSCGVGACVESYGVESKEFYTDCNNAVIDERTLREIYLKAFEIVVKESEPYAMQCCANRVNGVSVAENSGLIRRIVKDEWKYDGVLVSDFASVTDPVSSLEAGIGLELPGTGKFTVKEIMKAVENKEVPQKFVDEMAVSMVELLLKCSDAAKKSTEDKKETSDFIKGLEQSGYHYDRSTHRKIAWKAAQESAVLLKNTGILPLHQKKNIAVLGALAKTPRYQSKACRVRKQKDENYMGHEVASACQVLKEYGYIFGYADGYSLKKEEIEEELIQEALKCVEGRDAVIVFLGYPWQKKQYSKHLFLPKNQIALLDALLAVNKKVILVIQSDRIVRIPHIKQVEAVLYMGVWGCQGGRACVNLLSGQANPCGKLSETIPLSAKDIPSYYYMDSQEAKGEYRERFFVGYRFYDSAKRDVSFPFGYGLSYTTFVYKKAICDHMYCNFATDPEEKIRIVVPVLNTGSMDGKEIVQIYVHCKNAQTLRAQKELKAFQKIFIKQGDMEKAVFMLSRDDFATYSTLQKKWTVEDGEYEILVASSSRNILQVIPIQIEGVEKVSKNLLNPANKKEKYPTYHHLPEGVFKVEDEEYYALFEEKTPLRQEHTITLDSTLRELNRTFIGRMMAKKLVNRAIRKSVNPGYPRLKIRKENLWELSVYKVGIIYGQMSRKKILALIDIVNGRMIKGIQKLW